MLHSPDLINIKKWLGVVLTVALLSFVGTTNAQESITKKFVFRTHFYQNQKLPYRLFVPDAYSANIHYPLVLTLHGSGERGSNNTSQINNSRIATVWADPKNQTDHPSLVVSPQCPPTSEWSGDILLAVNDLLDSLQREFSVEANRLYITGLSMGGFGTWEMIQRFPDRFAAAIPMSGGAYLDITAPLLHQSIWNFHGENDDAVPAILSRYMMQALEFAGRPAIYTHCEFGDCSGMMLPEIQTAMQNHADLFYTEFQGLGHVMWDQAYDYPPLLPWVFQQVRRDPAVIHLISQQSYQILQGMTDIQWHSADNTDRIQLWYSNSLGLQWQLVSEMANTGSYAWDTSTCPDAAKAKIRIYALGQDDKIKGYDESAFFAVNNAGNGTPFAWINTMIWAATLWDIPELELAITASDAETDPLTAKIEYSSDDGKTYALIAQAVVSPDTGQQSLHINLEHLSNSSQARLKLVVDDGVFSDVYETRSFIKITPRKDSLQVSHVNGTAGAEIKPFVVDASQLDGERYRLQFAGSSGHLTYDVINLHDGAQVLQGVPLSATSAEGPVFNGLALSIKDIVPAQADYANSGWSKGQATLNFSMYTKEYRIGGVLRKSLPQPSDYLITFTDHIVDTSAAVFGVPPAALRYSIRNLTLDRAVESLFIDVNKDQMVSRQEYIYFIEPDSTGQPCITWSLFFSGDSTAILPSAGDELTLKTLKPLTALDIYEFVAYKTGIDNRGDKNTPYQVFLHKNYPNPFNGSTTISYDLGQAEKHLEVSVYNLLGQPVKVLFAGPQVSGHHQVRWDGCDDVGRPVPSGLYYYRLQGHTCDRVQSMILLK